MLVSSYITATHFLEAIHPKTLVVNNPLEVRNAPEKLCVTGCTPGKPPTLITSDPQALETGLAHGGLPFDPSQRNSVFGFGQLPPLHFGPNGAPTVFAVASRTSAGGTAPMTDTDVRDICNHIQHFGAYAVVHKMGRKWWVRFREFGCPATFATKSAAGDWAANWPSALRLSQRVRDGVQ